MRRKKEKRTDSAVMQTIVSVCIIIGAVILLLIAAIFGGVRGSDDEEEEDPEEIVELDLSYAYQNAQWNRAVENVIEQFEEEHPEIQINYEVPYSDSVYENELNRQIAMGELGDIVQLKTPEAYMESGLLGEISEELVEETGIESVCGVNGKIYAVGMVNSTSGIIYNREIFEQYGLEEPETYGEFLEICETLERRGVTPVGVGGSDLWHMEFWVNHFFRTDMLAENEDWLAECSEGTVSWTDEEAAEMFAHLLELFESGYVNEDWLSTSDGTLPYLMSEGEVAMIYSGAWTAEEILNLDSEMDLGWFYLPDEEGNVCVSEMQDTYWAVTAECAEDEGKYEAAMEFLRFFYENGNYSEICGAVTAFPVTQEGVSYELTGIQDEVIAAFENEENHITAYIGDADTPQGFEEEMLTAVEEMLQGERTIEETQKYCQEIWEEYGGDGT